MEMLRVSTVHPVARHDLRRADADVAHQQLMRPDQRK
jgi:hypothetical protein